jgi:hypothetical protein
MSQSSRKILISALLCAALACVVACKKGGGSAAAGDAMGYLPKDASAIIGINFDAIRSAALYKEFEPQLKKAMEQGEELKKIKDTCGLDVTSKVKSALVALGKDPNDEKQMYFAIVGLNKAEVNKCVDDLKAKGEKVDRKEDGDLASYTVDDKTTWAWWANADTLVSSPAAEGSPDAMKALATGPKLKDNAGVMEMIGKTDTGAMFWVAGEVPNMPDMDNVAAQLGAKPEKFSVSIHVPSNLAAKAMFVFGDEASAKKVHDTLKTQLDAAKQQPMVGAYLGGVKLETAGKEVTAGVDLKEEDVKTLSSMLKMAVGNMF